MTVINRRLRFTRSARPRVHKITAANRLARFALRIFPALFRLLKQNALVVDMQSNDRAAPTTHAGFALAAAI